MMQIYKFVIQTSQANLSLILSQLSLSLFKYCVKNAYDIFQDEYDKSNYVL
jgi:hypothetical protein